MKLSALFIAIAVAFAQDAIPQWTPAARMVTARANACIAPLPDGTMLVAGGDGLDGALNSAEIYQPDDRFLEAEPMIAARSLHTCTALSDGRVLATAGLAGGALAASAEFYDLQYGQWQQTANDPVARWGQSATLLLNGMVLIAGGENLDGPVDTIELFDPATNSFSVLPAVLSSPRKFHISALLPDGRILIAGGNDGTNDLATTDVIDVFSGTVTAGPPLPAPRSRLAGVSLSSGLVFLAGGTGDSELDSTLLVDTIANTVTPGPALRVARSSPQAVLIPNNGNVLILGGTVAGEPVLATDLYDATRNAMLPFGDLTLARTGIAAAAVGVSGDILATGGSSGGIPVAACGKTSNVTLTSDQPFYTPSQTATLTGHWQRKEDVDIALFEAPIGGNSTRILIRTIPNNNTSQFTFVTPPLTVGRSYIATATGHDSHDTASASFICGTTATTTLSVSPLVAAPVHTPVVFTVRVHPDLVLNAPIQGIFIIKNGPVSIASTSTTDPATYHVDPNGDGVATFSASTNLPAGDYNLAAQFFRSGNFIATSFSSGFQQFSIVKRTPVLNVSVQNGPARILGDLRIHLAMDPGADLGLAPTGFASMSEAGILLARNPLSPPPALGPIRSSDVILPTQSGMSVKQRTVQIHYEGDDVYLPATTTFVAPIKGLVPNIFVFSVQPTIATSPNTLTLGDFANLTVRMIPATGVSPHTPIDCTARCGSSDPNFFVTLDQPAPFHAVTGSTFMDDTEQSNGQGQWRTSIPRVFALGPAKVHMHFEGGPNYDAFDLPDLTINVIKGIPVFQVASSLTGSGSNRTAIVTVTLPVVQQNPLVGGALPPPITPTGTFQVSEGSVVLGSKVVSTPGAAVQAVTFSMPVSSGGHTYTVSYSGDSNWIPLVRAADPIIVP